VSLRWRGERREVDSLVLVMGQIRKVDHRFAVRFMSIISADEPNVCLVELGATQP